MKIFYSIDLGAVELHNDSVNFHPLSKYTKLEILHGLGYSYITLLFNYWEQKIVVIEGGILAFLYNAKGGINDLKSKKREVAHIFSIEEAYHLQMRLNKNQVIISAFNNQNIVDISKLEYTLAETSKKACKELEQMYTGLNENKYFDEIKAFLEI